MMHNKITLIYKTLILLLGMWLPAANMALSQTVVDKVDMSYNINTWDPVHIKVDEKKGSAIASQIKFMAINSTYYPFELKVDFSIFENLSPKPSLRDISISHGINNLYTLSPHVPETGYSYRYTYSYWLKPSDEIINENFPYLIPVKDGKVVIAKIKASGKIINSFAGNKDDTVYCMRRGLVTAAPGSETLGFRLSDHDCLEVMHDDGTFMIYHHLSKKEVFTAPGKIVLPGQPVGLVSDSSYFMVVLMKISKTRNILEYQPITYSTGNKGTAPFNEIDGKKVTAYPPEVIARELTVRELKKMKTKK